MEPGKRKKLVYIYFRLSYLFLVGYFLFVYLIPGIFILNTFDENIKHVKQAEGKLYVKRAVNKVGRIGIELPEGKRVLFFCDAGLMSRRYYCLREYAVMNKEERMSVVGKTVQAEWFEQDIPFRPQASNMLLSLTVDGKPHFPKQGIIKKYNEEADKIVNHLVFLFLMFLIIIAGSEFYLRKQKKKQAQISETNGEPLSTDNVSVASTLAKVFGITLLIVLVTVYATLVWL